MYRPLTNQHNFRISLLNRNSEGAINLELELLTGNCIYVEALRVFVLNSLPQMDIGTTNNYHYK